MKKTKYALLLLFSLLSATHPLRAQEDTNQSPDEVLQLIRNLKYQQGDIDLHGGLARLSVPAEFNYLGPDDAETVLVKLWGNPPSETKPLGLLLPAGMTPLNTNCWVVTIDYTEDGYVKDGDASTINYNDLLKTMQKAVAEQNMERQKQGYRTVELVGWAAPPRYDSATHKLYWAKELSFSGATHHTLNYNIRLLGRRGVLQLTAVARMSSFPEIDQQTPKILAMVDFKEGSRYADFDPKMDKVAKYGIAALVAGGLVVAAKAGLLKVFLVGLLAMKKFIIIGVVAFWAAIKKMFSRRGSSSGSP
jgi:uncharacterized membrane-anchored protein